MTPEHPRGALASVLRQWHRPLVVAAGLLAVLLAVSVVGLVADRRTLLGEPIWLKPLKFTFAFALYTLTLAWLLTLLTRARRFGWWMGTVIAACALLDVGVITLAAARGTFSHFNIGGDPLSSFTAQVLVYGVPPILVSNLVIAVLVLVQRVGGRALTTALRYGLVLAVFGTSVPYWLAFVGGIRRRTVLDANGDEVTLGAGHGIGDPDGAGMPITNWSATGGDLRAPHFIGMHGIHVLLLLTVVLGFLAARHAWLRDEHVRSRLVAVGGLAYCGLSALTAWQAARGQSFMHPDGLTLAIFAAVVLAAAAAAGAVVTAARRTPVPLGR
ncbi:hypothetical protein [Nonomuraea typhae]|uniref:hypothetical protein n=1 Tax=Nonomuraea typhae TaxID=2603600 RepID=UPI0012F7F4EE|nr:hypothetical protein [Nonomuraea typhae]